MPGMRARGIERRRQEQIVLRITSFALYGFPESHSASFALIAYASAYLKRHHPAAFLVGLLNAQPMGFYSPATLVKDAQRHGVEVLPVDVVFSKWRSELERGDERGERTGSRRRAATRGGRVASASPAPPPSASVSPRVRAASRAAERIVAERERAPFAGAADFSARVRPDRDELAALAELGALAGHRCRPRARAARRSGRWPRSRASRCSRFAGSARRGDESPAARDERARRDARRLPAQRPHDRRAPDGAPARGARRGGVLSRRGAARRARRRFVRTAGHAIVRQRPGTAKGFCFLTLEDETGTSNAVLTPRISLRFRAALHGAALLEVAGPLQSVEGVIHVRVRELGRCARAGAAALARLSLSGHDMLCSVARPGVGGALVVGSRTLFAALFTPSRGPAAAAGRAGRRLRAARRRTRSPPARSRALRSRQEASCCASLDAVDRPRRARVSAPRQRGVDRRGSVPVEPQSALSRRGSDAMRPRPDRGRGLARARTVSPDAARLHARRARRGARAAGVLPAD